VGRVVEGAAFHVDVGGSFQQRDEAVRRPRDPWFRQSLVVEGDGQHFEHVAGRGELREHVGRGAGPLERMDGEAAVGLLEAPGTIDRVVEHGGRGGPTAGVVSAGSAVRSESHGEAVEPMGPPAGRREYVGVGLHGNDILGGPPAAVTRRPRSAGRQPGRQGHQGPGRLLPGTNVVLCLGEKIGEREAAARHHDRRVERHAAHERPT
jgi:hypothetical protein